MYFAEEYIDYTLPYVCVWIYAYIHTLCNIKTEKHINTYMDTNVQINNTYKYLYMQKETLEC